MPPRRLTKAEKKKQMLEKQLEQVQATMRKNNIQTVVYNNPDSKSANSRVATERKDKNKSSLEEDSDVQLDMKKARHEIMKFGMSSLKSKDLEDAEQSLAISLGARPSKRPAVNYKDLQLQRKQEKEVQKEREASSFKPDLKKFFKKPQPKKGKAGKNSKKDHGSRSGNKNDSKKRSRK